MNRYVSRALGLFVAASACSAIAAPVVGHVPSSLASKAQMSKAPAASKDAAARTKALQQDQPCPYRRS